MKIAYVSSDQRGETDRLLARAAEQLRAAGLRLSGLVRDFSYESGFENGCDMQVCVLPDGPVIKITQSLGKGSDSCRLDPAAIAEAVAQVESSAAEQADLRADLRADLLILNKFGPEESAGRGFCAVIAQALERGVPVLVGVSRANLDAFEAFAGGLAEPVPADPGAILDWSRKAASGQARLQSA